LDAAVSDFKLHVVGYSAKKEAAPEVLKIPDQPFWLTVFASDSTSRMLGPNRRVISASSFNVAVGIDRLDGTDCIAGIEF
jgi:hypothetical protein